MPAFSGHCKAWACTAVAEDAFSATNPKGPSLTWQCLWGRPLPPPPPRRRWLQTTHRPKARPCCPHAATMLEASAVPLARCLGGAVLAVSVSGPPRVCVTVVHTSVE